MKKAILSRSLLIIMMIAAMSMSTVAWAQGPGNGKGKSQGMKQGNPAMHMKRMIPSLTEEQGQKITSLRTETMKKTNPLKAQMREEKAHLNTLSIAEKPDMKAINKTIDEMSALRTEMMKIHAQMRQDVRSLLNDDQRVVFDSKAASMKAYGAKAYYGSRSGWSCMK